MGGWNKSRVGLQQRQAGRRPREDKGAEVMVVKGKGGEGAGPAHHGRLADAAFPRGALAFAEGA